MRTKDQIIGHLFDDVKTAHKIGELEHVTDIPLLEVLIDIRDILITDAKDAMNALIEIRKTH